MEEENITQKLTDVGTKILHHLDFEFDRSAGTIFVTGGHGVLSYRVASRLLNAGYPTVRVGALHADELSDLSKLGAEVADFCWSNDGTYAKALNGAKTVFCTLPHHEGWEKDFDLFLEACEEAEVKHIVKMSFYHANWPVDQVQEVPLVNLHGQCDKKLMQSGIAYTILAASHLMSNPLVYQMKSLQDDKTPAKLYGASAGRAVNYVSPNDVADVAVRALLAPKDHVDKLYSLTGPVAIKEEEVAALLGKFMNKPVIYVDQPIEFFEMEEKRSGDPLWLVEDLVALEKMKASGHEGYISFLSMDFENICGHKAETFEDYLSSIETMSPREKALVA